MGAVSRYNVMAWPSTRTSRGGFPRTSGKLLVIKGDMNVEHKVYVSSTMTGTIRKAVGDDRATLKSGHLGIPGGLLKLWLERISGHAPTFPLTVSLVLWSCGLTLWVFRWTLTLVHHGAVA